MFKPPIADATLLVQLASLWAYSILQGVGRGIGRGFVPIYESLSSSDIEGQEGSWRHKNSMNTLWRVERAFYCG